MGPIDRLPCAAATSFGSSGRISPCRDRPVLDHAQAVGGDQQGAARVVANEVRDGDEAVDAAAAQVREIGLVPLPVVGVVDDLDELDARLRQLLQRFVAVVRQDDPYPEVLRRRDE